MKVIYFVIVMLYCLFVIFGLSVFAKCPHVDRLQW